MLAFGPCATGVCTTFKSIIPSTRRAKAREESISVDRPPTAQASGIGVYARMSNEYWAGQRRSRSDDYEWQMTKKGEQDSSNEKSGRVRESATRPVASSSANGQIQIPAEVSSSERIIDQRAMGSYFSPSSQPSDLPVDTSKF